MGKKRKKTRTVKKNESKISFKLIILILIVGFVAGGIFVILLNRHEGDSRVDNDDAIKNPQKRYLSIINDTDQIINEVHVMVGEGIEIEKAYQKNPDEKSYSIEIPKEYEKFDTFTIVFIDRYGLKYQTVVSDVKTEGMTEVKVSEEDYIKQDGDLKRKWDRMMNGD